MDDVIHEQEGTETGTALANDQKGLKTGTNLANVESGTLKNCLN